MLNRILPSNSTSWRRVRFIARHLNFAALLEIRKNFIDVKLEDAEKLRRVLIESYLPSWYAGEDMNTFFESDEGQQAINNHMFHRLEDHRYTRIPWINSVVKLSSAKILEIGCGTGASTVSLAEQGAAVTALDLDGEALKVAKIRCRVYGRENVCFVQANATDIGNLFTREDFDLVIFWAALEHMTIRERKSALRAAWDLLRAGKHLCITNTPNRLWFYDGHTARLPFFNWLPDELAFEYSEWSPRSPFNRQFRKADSESMLRLIREGRGMSFHELDLSLTDGCKYTVVSDLCSFLSRTNPARGLKRILAGDNARERILNSYAPDRDRGFFKDYLDIILRKVQ